MAICGTVRRSKIKANETNAEKCGEVRNSAVIDLPPGPPLRARVRAPMGARTPMRAYVRACVRA